MLNEITTIIEHDDCGSGCRRIVAEAQPGQFVHIRVLGLEASALRHPISIFDAHRVTKLPILAMGGVYEAKDAIEFFLADATAVAVGTETFTNPNVVAEVYDGIADYCERHGFASVADLTGALVLGEHGRN